MKTILSREKDILSEIEIVLTDELKKCHAPVTGRLVACALFTENGLYIGHNTEWGNPVLFEHAEVDAFKLAKNAEENPNFSKVVMLGGGTVFKLKQYTPCYFCTKLLAPFTSDSTEVILLPFSADGEVVHLSFKDLLLCCASFPYSKFKGKNKSEICGELQSKTLLNAIDSNFVAELSAICSRYNANLYLTGSAAGRGGAGWLLSEKTNSAYKDFDLLIVTKKETLELEKEINALVKHFYGDYRRDEPVIPVYKNKHNLIYKKLYYYAGPKEEKVIDFTFGKTLEGSFMYKEYFFNNWFYQIV